jgi:hypothetical protein
MVLTRHTHIYSSLVQGRRSGWRLCGKIGYGDKPSLFIMCNFHDLGINIYQEKNKVHYFLGNPRISQCFAFPFKKSLVGSKFLQCVHSFYVTAAYCHRLHY